MTLRDTGSYAATLMGFIIGSVVGAILCAFIVSPFQGAGEFGLLFIDVLAGALVGGIAGSWGLLRVCAYPAAGRTARNMIVGWIMLAALQASTSFMNAQGNGILWLVLAILVGICIGARWVALASTSQQADL